MKIQCKCPIKMVPSIVRMNAILFALLLTGGALRFMITIEQNIYYGLCILALSIITLLRLWVEPVAIHRWGFTYLMGIAVLSAWLIISVTWTESIAQYLNDLQLLLGLFLTVILVMLNDSDVFFNSTLDDTVVLTLVVSIFVICQSGGALGLKGSDVLADEFYLTAGRTIAIGYLISLIRFLLSKQWSLGWAVLSCIHITALAVSLARGPLIFSVVIITLLLVLGFEIRRNNLWIRPLLLGKYFALLILVLIIVSMTLKVENTRTRLFRIFTVSNELLEGGRGIIWKKALDHIGESPLIGYGLGSSGLMSAGTEDLYPHNFLLQIWLDGGLPGVVILAIIVCLPFAVAGKCRTTHWKQNATLIITGSCYLLLLLEYSKSHNFYIARDLFFFGTGFLLQASCGKQFNRNGGAMDG